jgi:hypothetical protein
MGKSKKIFLVARKLAETPIAAMIITIAICGILFNTLAQEHKSIFEDAPQQMFTFEHSTMAPVWTFRKHTKKEPVLSFEPTHPQIFGAVKG